MTKSAIDLRYQLIRNLTSPEENANGVQTYFANVPIKELEKMNTRDNLRDYIPGADPFKPAKRNSVHRAIERTIRTESDRFINRNGGLTLTCSSMTVDDKAKVATLKFDSVINGAQTRGEVLRYLDSFDPDDIETSGEPEDFHIRAEIIVDPDHASVVETAIARNSASPVKSISQAGGRGQLDELNRVVLAATGNKIQLSETDTAGALDTFHILQATRLLMPIEVSGSDTPSELLRPYKQRALCLEDFTGWFQNKDSDEASAARYQFTLDMAATAIEEFQYWQSGEMFNGKSIRAEVSDGRKKRTFRRDKKGGRIIWVSPGVVFPVLSAMRHFVVRKDGTWRLQKPEIFDEDELVDAALEQWRAHDTNPMDLGRSAGAYSALSYVTRAVKRAAEKISV
ncbi:MAG: AIPR family protein [Pseudomonadota bacterium]